MDLSSSEIRIPVSCCLPDILYERRLRSSMFRADLLILSPSPQPAAPRVLSTSVSDSPVCAQAQTLADKHVLHLHSSLSRPPSNWSVIRASSLVSLIVALPFCGVLVTAARVILQVGLVLGWKETLCLTQNKIRSPMVAGKCDLVLDSFLALSLSCSVRPLPPTHPQLAH